MKLKKRTIHVEICLGKQGILQEAATSTTMPALGLDVRAAELPMNIGMTPQKLFGIPNAFNAIHRAPG
jgi:hypothetical protein